MHQWLNAHCAKLLKELNNTPFTDDVDEIKLNLIRNAMREASLELFHRAADNSRKMIEQIHREEFSEKVHQAETHTVDEVLKDTESLLEQAAAEPSAVEQNKPAPKLQLSSSIIRRDE